VVRRAAARPYCLRPISLSKHPREVTKAFSRIAKKAGFPGLRLHDMRHNCASHMLAAGCSVPAVAAHLGHSTPAITMAVYARAIPQKEPGAGMLDELMTAGA
jgi:integrase